MNSKYRYLVPNGITFISLICGTVSIFLSASGDPDNLPPAAILILASYILDLLDGAMARRLKAGSEFGLQLDSLVDMVSLGMAPATLIFAHLNPTELNSIWVWFVAVAVPMAGAFRLARFNLLPPKATGNTDSVGLTISTGGAMLALTVLSANILPPVMVLIITFVMCLLMVSTVSFPSFYWIFSGRRRNIALISMFGVSIAIAPTFSNAWFFWTNAYLGLSLARAGYKSVNSE